MMFRYLCMCLLWLLPGVSDAAELGQLSKQAKPATAFIFYDATDEATGAPIPVRGSGVVVSTAGHVLTAFHLLKPWLAQTSAEREKQRIYVKLGSIHAEPLEVEIDGFETDEPDGKGPDIAVLKIRREGTYTAAQSCYPDKRNMGDRLVAFGFPGGMEFNYAEGAIAHSDGPGNRWTANINFDRGMSGGPVYDARDGWVIGLVKGGAKDLAPVRYITQLTRAKAKLEAAGVVLQYCRPQQVTGPTASPVVELPAGPPGCREVAYTDYSKMPPEFSKRTVCN